MAKLSTKLAIKLLNKTDLPLEDRSLLITCVLDRLVALPLRDIILINEQGSLLVNGRSLDINQARYLRESARVALDNAAFKLIREQVAFASIVTGVHKAENDKQILFAKAALWWGQQEEALLKLLAQDSGQESDLPQ